MQTVNKTGLFFGSFNPVHIGHLAIANYMVAFADLDQVWFIISPQNPFKEKTSLLADYHRLELINLAIGDDLRFKASDIEFRMARPSYTIHTLEYLREKYPQNHFELIMGSDQLPSFHRWKNYQQILKDYRLLVYPRPGSDDHELISHPSVSMSDAPRMDISSSMIRHAISEGKDVRHFLPSGVWKYLDEMNFYR